MELAEGDLVAVQASPDPFLPPILILSPVKNTNVRRQERQVQNLLSLRYPRALLSVAWGVSLSSSARDMALVEASVAELRRAGFGSALALRDSVAAAAEPHGGEQNSRHAFGFQLRRRGAMARARNQLLFQALRPHHGYVLWLDADLLSYPTDLLLRLLDTGKELVVPLCLDAPGRYQYDLNSWQATSKTRELLASLPSTTPLLQGYEHIQSKTVQYLKHLRPEGALVPLDGIGGTCILVKADLHRSGLVFPAFLQNHCIETEGLAQTALLMGVQPWGLTNLTVRHA